MSNRSEGLRKVSTLFGRSPSTGAGRTNSLSSADQRALQGSKWFVIYQPLPGGCLFPIAAGFCSWSTPPATRYAQCRCRWIGLPLPTKPCAPLSLSRCRNPISGSGFAPSLKSPGEGRRQWHSACAPCACQHPAACFLVSQAQLLPAEARRGRISPDSQGNGGRGGLPSHLAAARTARAPLWSGRRATRGVRRG